MRPQFWQTWFLMNEVSAWGREHSYFLRACEYKLFLLFCNHVFRCTLQISWWVNACVNNSVQHTVEEDRRKTAKFFTAWLDSARLPGSKIKPAHFRTDAVTFLVGSKVSWWASKQSTAPASSQWHCGQYSSQRSSSTLSCWPAWATLWIRVSPRTSGAARKGPGRTRSRLWSPGGNSNLNNSGDRTVNDRAATRTFEAAYIPQITPFSFWVGLLSHPHSTDWIRWRANPLVMLQNPDCKNVGKLHKRK